jgi:septal ring factor EnvC (AmiA/AmiB activator)
MPRLVKLVLIRHIRLMAEPDLTFIAKQLERVLAELAGMRDEMLVLGARMGYVERSFERVEAAMTVLTLEVRANRNQLARMDDRLRNLEDAAP